MIRIHKSNNVPAVLANQGILETAKLIATFSQAPQSYTSAPKKSSKLILKLQFDNNIYGDSTVKDQLIFEQHDKCCFCEGKFSENSYGDVEHYRPKKAYKKAGSKNLTYPGYYWLAYTWNNLMFSCEKCNRKYKRNDFPITNENNRAVNHTIQYANEDCLLINPCIEDPSLFIKFDDEVPLPVNDNQKGKTSIKVYGLERLNTQRLDYLILLDGLLAFYKIDPNNNEQMNLAIQTFGFSRNQVLEKITQATRFFHSAAKDTAVFALCVRCKFPQLPTA